LTARTLTLAREIVDRATTDELVLRIYEPLRMPFVVYNSDSPRLEALTVCGMKLDKGHYGKYCLPAVEVMEPHVPWQATFLQVRAESYKTTNNPRWARAERDLKTFWAEQPSRLGQFYP
jgi:hypothetical protein